MFSATPHRKVWHPLWGGGSLIRIEGTDWIIRLEPSGKCIRIPTDKRFEFEVGPVTVPSVVNGDSTQVASSAKTDARVPAGNNPSHDERADLRLGIREPLQKPHSNASPILDVGRAPIAPPRPEVAASAAFGAAAWSGIATWYKRRAIESLANGLPPAVAIGRQLAVDFDSTVDGIDRFLHDVSVDGGCAVLVKGSYGQGKTFALRCLEEIALEAGYIVARTEIDATENRLNKPPHIYRDLLRHIRVPQHPGRGAAALAQAANIGIKKQIGAHGFESDYRRQWLERNLGCRPLAWLLADPQVDTKPELIGLLACEPGVSATVARRAHCINVEPRMWPAFNAGTQGDFGSYLLSGIGRLARLMGLQGLILVMDEMEKWQDLNWKEQSQAGNLLGGLIWGATERTNRARLPTFHRASWTGASNHYPQGLTHSGRGGGFPFSTEPPSHIGLAIAITPRSEEQSPEKYWAEFGPLRQISLPQLDTTKLRQYCARVGPLFADAYDARPPASHEMDEIKDDAVRLWRTHGELTNRAAVQSSVAAFHSWRERSVLCDQA